MGPIRDLFVQTETFVLFFACITVKNRPPVPLPLARGVERRWLVSMEAGLFCLRCGGTTEGVQT